MSDFNSNEHANLIGGPRYVPEEETPMIGFRGAGRYVAESFRECFEMEYDALKHVQHDMGLTNVEIMVPFVLTLKQARALRITPTWRNGCWSTASPACRSRRIR